MLTIDRCKSAGWKAFIKSKWMQEAALFRINLAICRLFDLVAEYELPYGEQSPEWVEIAEMIHNELDLVRDIRIRPSAPGPAMFAALPGQSPCFTGNRDLRKSSSFSGIPPTTQQKT